MKSVGKFAFGENDIEKVTGDETEKGKPGVIVLGKNIEKYGDSVFSGCIKLTSVSIPGHVKEVPNYMFAGCSNLKNIELEEGIKKLGVICFYGTKVEEVTIPASVTEVGGDLGGVGKWFENCTNLKRIKIAEGSQAILEGAFARIHSSYVIDIPDSVKSVGKFAFAESDIEKVTGDETEKGKPGVIVLGKNIEKYGDSVFRGCEKLTSVSIPSHVKEVSNYMFTGCSNLKNIELEEGIKKLGVICFYGTKVEEVTIPASVTEVGGDWGGAGKWFENCTNLKKIKIADGSQAILEGAFARIQSDFVIDIPDSVKKIDTYAFGDCPNFTVVNMPPNLEYIGRDTFVNSPKLTIYSPMNYVVLQKVFEDRLKFELKVGNMNMNYGIVDDEESSYTISGINELGDITLRLKYKLKEDINELGDAVIRIRLRDSVDLKEDYILLDGSSVNNYVYRDDIITIPVSKNSGIIEFKLSRNEYEELLSYASINYTRNGERRDDLIAYLKEQVDAISINDTSVHGSHFKVEGVTTPNKSVRIFLDDKFVGSQISDGKGRYSITISIENQEVKQYTLKAIAEGISRQATSKIIIDPGHPEVEHFYFKYPGNGGSNEFNLMQLGIKKHTISLANRAPLEYYVKFKNDSKVDKVFIHAVDARLNERKIEAHRTSDTKIWITKGYFDNTNHNYTPNKVWITYTEKSEEDKEKERQKNLKALAIYMSKDFLDSVVKVLKEKEKIENEEIGRFYKNASKGHSIYDAYDNINEVIKAIELAGSINRVSKLLKKGESERSAADNMGLINEALIIAKYFVYRIPLIKTQAMVFFLIQEKTNGLLYKINKTLEDIEAYSKELADLKPENLPQKEKTIESLLSAIDELEGYMQELRELEEKPTGSERPMPKFKFDPSGYVYEAVLSNRLQGATVSIYQWDEISYMPLLWNAIEYGQENKQKTGETGTFGWDVPDGRWQLKCEKDGYESYTGEWLTVPPIHTDIKIPMISTEKPVISDTVRNGKELRVVFSKYMKPETLDGITITDLDGNNISYSMEYSKQEKDANNNIYAKEYIFKISDERDNIPLILNITDKVQSYAGISMDTEQNYIP